MDIFPQIFGNYENDAQEMSPQTLEDGALMNLAESEQEEQSFNPYFRNLAEEMEEEVLNKISTTLGDLISEDEKARREWLSIAEQGKKLLGFSLEDDERPFEMSCVTFDTTLSSALLRGYATIRSEILPPLGPAGYTIMGNSDEEIERIAEVRSDYLNYHLTVKDAEYYRDYEQFLFYLLLYGSAFRKVYREPFTNKVVSRFIAPQNFIVNSDCTSIANAERITHVLHLSARDIIGNQNLGYYRDISLPYLQGNQGGDNDDDADDESSVPLSEDNIDLTEYSKKSLFPVEEIHTYLDLESFSKGYTDEKPKMPLPYIIIRDRITKKIFGIYENWEENSPDFKRKNFFVPYQYLAGFGIYGIGMAHIAGTNAQSLTSIQRQIIDAGTFQNFPGGMRKKGMKQQNDMPMVTPGTFVEFDTGGESLDEAFKLFPFAGPSSGLFQAWERLRETTMEVLSASELKVNDVNSNAPVGTVQAIINSNNKVLNVIQQSLHYSFTLELRLIDKFLGEDIMVEEFSYGGKKQIIRHDYFTDEVAIIPIADPQVNSETHKILRAQSIMQVASQYPELFDPRTVAEKALKAFGLNQSEIRELMPEQDENEAQNQTSMADQLVLADIQQKDREAEIRLQIAQMKTENDAFREQMKMEIEKMKMLSNERIAGAKMETELIKQENSYEY